MNVDKYEAASDKLLVMGCYVKREKLMSWCQYLHEQNGLI